MSKPVRTASLFSAAIGLLALATPSHAQVAERCNVSTAGVEGNADASQRHISGNGRYVVFASEATNLVSGDNNAARDVFIRDTELGVTVRLSTSAAGVEGNFASSEPRVTDSATETVFMSDATKLVPGDVNGVGDIFLKHWPTGAIEIVSLTSTGDQANQMSFAPGVSGDGNRIVFVTVADNVVPGDTNAKIDVFVRDRALATTTRASVSSGGMQATDHSTRPVISGDGSRVAFESAAVDLQPGDINGESDVFVHIVDTGATFMASTTATGVQGNGPSTSPSISTTGRYVAFLSEASNLVPGDTNGVTDVFVKDLTTGGIVRANVSSAGLQTTDSTASAMISGDARFVAFDTNASNLVVQDTNAQFDVFLRDLDLGVTTRLSTDDLGVIGNMGSFRPSISNDGSEVAFWSFADNLVPGDTNGLRDVFYVDRYAVGGVAYCTAGTSASGCQAVMGAIGTSSASASSGFELTTYSIEAQKDGIVFFGLNGAQANSWGNGSSFHCVVPPIRRTPVQSSGGTLGTCGGKFSIDFNAWSTNNPGKAPPVGATVFAQTWYRDLFNTSNQTTSLSDAWQFSVAP